MYGIVFITDMFAAGEWNIGLPTVYIGANLQRYIQPAFVNNISLLICLSCGRSFSFLHSFHFNILDFVFVTVFMTRVML